MRICTVSGSLCEASLLFNGRVLARPWLFIGHGSRSDIDWIIGTCPTRTKHRSRRGRCGERSPAWLVARLGHLTL